MVSVSLPYSLGNTQVPIVYYIDENGSQTFAEGRYDEKSGYVLFNTYHFSVFKFRAMEADTCTLAFDTNGGDHIEAYICAIGRIIVLPEAIKKDAVFEGWIDPNGTTYLANDSYTMNGDTLANSIQQPNYEVYPGLI